MIRIYFLKQILKAGFGSEFWKRILEANFGSELVANFNALGTTEPTRSNHFHKTVIHSGSHHRTQQTCIPVAASSTIDIMVMEDVSDDDDDELSSTGAASLADHE